MSLSGKISLKTNIISDKAAVDEIIKEFIASKRVINREIQLETKNRNCLSRFIINRNHRQQIEKLILIVLTDISVQKKAEYQAQHQQGKIGIPCKHEPRNTTPMNSILGFSEILLTEIEEPKYSSYLKAISNSGKTLLTLINDILDLSKSKRANWNLSRN
jgi:signal transduction histidine kinase